MCVQTACCWLVSCFAGFVTMLVQVRAAGVASRQERAWYTLTICMHYYSRLFGYCKHDGCLRSEYLMNMVVAEKAI